MTLGFEANLDEVKKIADDDVSPDRLRMRLMKKYTNYF